MTMESGLFSSCATPASSEPKGLHTRLLTPAEIAALLA
jgi:hypothetical protein